MPNVLRCSDHFNSWVLCIGWKLLTVVLNLFKEHLTNHVFSFKKLSEKPVPGGWVGFTDLITKLCEFYKICTSLPMHIHSLDSNGI